MKLKAAFILGTLLSIYSCKEEEYKIPITLNISNNYNTYITEVINFINDNEYTIEDTSKVQYLHTLTSNYHQQLVQHKGDLPANLFEAYNLIYDEIQKELIPTIDTLCRIENIDTDTASKYELDQTVLELNKINADLKNKQQNLKLIYQDFLKINNIKMQ